MRLVALMPIRNEDWILGLSLRAVLRWADQVAVVLHCCTDGSRQIVEQVAKENPNRVLYKVIDDACDYYPETRVRNTLLAMGRDLGATHFALVDADEVLCGTDLDHVRNVIAQLQPPACLSVPMRPLWRSLWQVRTDYCVWTQARISLAFAEGPHLVGWQSRDGYEWHKRHPYDCTLVPCDQLDGVMHLQFANWRRLRAKHAWYKMMEALRCPWRSHAEIDAQYNMALDEAGLITEPVPSAWWEPYSDLLGYVDMGKPPWHEQQVQQWWSQHGPAVFGGLNLFGLAGAKC